MKFPNVIGMSESMFEDKSSFMRFVHLATVISSTDFMFVPARIKSFKVAGSFIKSLI